LLKIKGKDYFSFFVSGAIVGQLLFFLKDIFIFFF